MVNKPIFFDASGRRAARITTIGWVVAVLAGIVFIGFVVSLALSPPVTTLDLPGRAVAVNPSNLIKRAQKPGLLARAERLGNAARRRRAEAAARLRQRSELPNRVLPAILTPPRAARSPSPFTSTGVGRQIPVSHPSSAICRGWTGWFPLG